MRYQNLDANFRPLESGAGGHVFTFDSLQQLIFAVALLDGGEEHTADEADKLVADCRLGDVADWRQPTVEEEFLIRDRTRHSPAMDPAHFPDQPGDGWVWTSTPCAWNPASAAWVVILYDGYANSYHRNSLASVRAVRSGVPAGQ